VSVLSIHNLWLVIWRSGWRVGFNARPILPGV